MEQGCANLTAPSPTLRLGSGCKGNTVILVAAQGSHSPWVYRFQMSKNVRRPWIGRAAKQPPGRRGILRGWGLRKTSVLTQGTLQASTAPCLGTPASLAKRRSLSLEASRVRKRCCCSTCKTRANRAFKEEHNCLFHLFQQIGLTHFRHAPPQVIHKEVVVTIC